MVAASLHRKGALAEDVSVEQAADIRWALGSLDMYRILLIERGWSARQYGSGSPRRLSIQFWTPVTSIDEKLLAKVYIHKQGAREIEI